MWLDADLYAHLQAGLTSPAWAIGGGAGAGLVSPTCFSAKPAFQPSLLFSQA
jgi:hypothetical protein